MEPKYRHQTCTPWNIGQACFQILTQARGFGPSSNTVPGPAKSISDTVLDRSASKRPTALPTCLSNLPLSSHVPACLLNTMQNIFCPTRAVFATHSAPPESMSCPTSRSACGQQPWGPDPHVLNSHNCKTLHVPPGWDSPTHAHTHTPQPGSCFEQKPAAGGCLLSWTWMSPAGGGAFCCPFSSVFCPELVRQLPTGAFSHGLVPARSPGPTPVLGWDALWQCRGASHQCKEGLWTEI